MIKQLFFSIYSKYSVILNTGKPDKQTYTNSADPDQTVPFGEVWSVHSLFAILTFHICILVCIL